MGAHNFDVADTLQGNPFLGITHRKCNRTVSAVEFYLDRF